MKQVTSVLIGAGNRGAKVYSRYALENPEIFKVVSVVEPDEIRRKHFAAEHNIPDKYQFKSFEDFIKHDKISDCVMICTQDRFHLKPVTECLKKNYHVLCEKPMTPDKYEIIQMGEFSKKYNRILTICHVLRYSPFFEKIKEILDNGIIGKLMSIQYIEEVGFWHHAHSFVRGNWRNSKESSPMILQKSCHDMDIILWLAGEKCKKVSSFGSLTYFNYKNKPEDAPLYCLDGCKHSDTCLYYAPNLYLKRPEYIKKNLVNAVCSDINDISLLEALKKGPYGRCVFQCDNDVVDHQVVNIEFENDITASFTMSAFTENCGRVINLMGTSGQIKGDNVTGIINITDFKKNETKTIKVNEESEDFLEMDRSLIKSFIKEVSTDGEYTGKTGADISVDSHLIALASEDSRIRGEAVNFKEYKSKLYDEIKF